MRQQQHLKRFSHALGRDEVLELERDLGALLGKLAILECVGKLRFFADADQELRLGEQGERLKSLFASDALAAR